MHSSHMGWSSPTGCHSVIMRRAQRSAAGPRSTHHAIVLGDRHGRSVLTEGGQPMASERPAKALSEEG